MRSLLLSVLVGLAVASTTINEQAFRARKEYQYQYETQIVTGMLPYSSIRSGFRLRCQARIQFSTFTKIRVQFDNVALYRLNNPVVQQKADEQLIPEEFLTDFVAPEAETIIQYMQIPFGFEYQDGHVMRVILDDRETEWSANAKRGFVSMFEMNLEKRLILEDYRPKVDMKTQPQTDSYKVFEQSAAGICTTQYSVQTSDASPNMFVTKVRDYSQCLERADDLDSIFDGVMVKNGQKENPLSNAASFRYALKGNMKRFIILSAVGENKIAFSPYRNQGEIRTTINQTLVLQKAHKISETREIPECQQGKHKKQGLGIPPHTYPSYPVEPQRPVPDQGEPKQISNPADVYPVDAILTHLRQAAENTRELTSEESLVHLRIVVDMLRTSPKPIIKQLWEKVDLSKVKLQADQDRLAKQIMWNVLPHVGTDAAASLILDVCSEELKMADNCTYALNTLTLKAKPTIELINRFIELTKQQKVQQSPKLKQVVYLSLGSLGYKLSQANKMALEKLDLADRLIQSWRQNKKKLLRNFVRMHERNVEGYRTMGINRYNQAGHAIVEAIRGLVEKGKTDEKILGLKALANCGLPQAVPVLRKVLQNPTEPQFLRILSILGFRRICCDESAQRMTMKTLLNIYMNPKESNEVRNMAFLQLMQQKPEKAVLQDIAQRLNYEKDAHVSNFVVSWFQSQANSTFSPFEHLKQNCTDALKFAPYFSKGFDHSFTKSYGKYSKSYKMGVSAKVTTIGNMFKYEGWALNLDTYIYGLYSNFMEVGVNSEAMSQFYDKLFGPRGLLTSNKSVFDLLKRVPRDASPQDTIQAIFRQLRITPRTMNFPSIHVYYKMMDHEMRYYDLTSYLSDITTQGKFNLDFNREGLRAGLPVDIQTMVYLLDTKKTLPTESGLPISLKLQASASIKVQGSVSVKVTPYMLEDDRQGRPPLGLEANVDLTPKTVVELYGCMGLDWYYIKPVAAFRGLIKTNMPFQADFSFDIAQKKFKMIRTMSEQLEDKPMTEIKIEPYAETVVLTNSKKSPVMRIDRLPLSLPMESKVKPVNQWYNLKPLGYKFGIVGQLPEKFSLKMPFCPLSGRTLINAWIKPLENAPKKVTIQGQFVYPMRKAIGNSYAPSYQETLTTYSDNTRMSAQQSQKQHQQKLDKFGRPLPTSLQDITPCSDPIDLNKDTPNMYQMAVKFEQKTGKPMPFYNKPEARGLILTIDASSGSTLRKSQLESVWAYFNDGQISAAFMRLWRSALPDYDSQEWQMITELGMTYPYKKYEPQDIFSHKAQKQIMKDLQSLVSLNSHEVVNEIMNLTLLSQLQQYDYPAQTRVPASRILATLVPQQLYKIMNQTGNTGYGRNWQYFYKTLGPIYMRVKEEKKLTVDPTFQIRDAIIFDLFDRLTKTQQALISELDEIIRSTVVVYGELPVAQYFVFNQARIVFMLDQIVQESIANGAINNAREAKDRLKQCEQLLDTTVRKMVQLMSTVITISDKLDRDGRPMMLTQPNTQSKLRQQQQPNDYDQRDQRYQQYSTEFGSQPSSYYTPQDDQKPREDSSYWWSTGSRSSDSDDDDVYEDNSDNLYMKDNDNNRNAMADALFQSLNKLTLLQVQTIKDIQLSMSNKKQVDTSQVFQLVKDTRSNITFFDKVWKNQRLANTVMREQVLLVTVQNELIVQQMEECRRRESKGQLPQQKRTSFWWKKENVETFLAKDESYYLAQRVNSLYRNKMLNDVVAPELTEREQPVYNMIQTLRRRLAVDMREFEMKLANNLTARRDPVAVNTAFDKFINRMDSYNNKLNEVVKAIEALDTTPRVYMIADLVETIHQLKFVVEFGRVSILALNNEQRMSWIEALDKQATHVQSLMSNLSPIFEKFVQQSQQSDNQRRVPMLNSIPVDVRVVEIQDMLRQQKSLLKQIRKFIQSSKVSNAVLQHVLATVLDRCQVLQQTLKQSQVQVEAALEQSQHYHRYAISSVFTKAINQQRKIYEVVRRTLRFKHNSLENIPMMMQKVTSEERELSQLEDDINQKLYDLQSQQEQPDDREPVFTDDYTRDNNNQDSYRQQDSYDRSIYNPQNDVYNAKPMDRSQRKQLKLQPLSKWSYLPTGITGLLNVTWGNPNESGKGLKVQLLASRNVEQYMWFYKQMDAMARSMEMKQAISSGLQDKVWDGDNVRDRLNSFNHMHFIAQFEKKSLPAWVPRLGETFQEYVKFSLYQHYIKQQPTSDAKDNQAQLIFDISSANKKYNMFLMTPKETNKFLSIPLPSYTKAFKPNQNCRSMYQQMVTYFSDNFTPAQCLVNSDKVRTLDKVTYQLPDSSQQCRTLLAMDCSQEKTFAITMTKSNSSYQGHAVQVMNDDKMIEIIPGYLDVQVKINGVPLVLEENKPISFSKQLHYQRYEHYLTITRRSQRVDIELPMTGVFLTMEGKYIRIQVSELFKKKICGLCGNFDTQLSYEFEGPRQEIYATSKNFAHSYVMHDDNCPVQKVPVNVEDRQVDPRYNHQPDFDKDSKRMYDFMRPRRPKGGVGSLLMEEQEEEQDQKEVEQQQHNVNVLNRRPRPFPRINEDQDQDEQQPQKQNRKDKSQKSSKKDKRPVESHPRFSQGTILDEEIDQQKKHKTQTSQQDKHKRPVRPIYGQGRIDDDDEQQQQRQQQQQLQDELEDLEDSDQPNRLRSILDTYDEEDVEQQEEIEQLDRIQITKKNRHHNKPNTPRYNQGQIEDDDDELEHQQQNKKHKNSKRPTQHHFSQDLVDEEDEEEQQVEQVHSIKKNKDSKKPNHSRFSFVLTVDEDEDQQQQQQQHQNQKNKKDKHSQRPTHQLTSEELEEEEDERQQKQHHHNQKDRKDKDSRKPHRPLFSQGTDEEDQQHQDQNKNKKPVHQHQVEDEEEVQQQHQNQKDKRNKHRPSQPRNIQDEIDEEQVERQNQIDKRNKHRPSQTRKVETDEEQQERESQKDKRNKHRPSQPRFSLGRVESDEEQQQQHQHQRHEDENNRDSRRPIQSRMDNDIDEDEEVLNMDTSDNIDDENDSEQDESKPVPVTDIKLRKKKHQTCFSKKPVLKCSIDYPKVEKTEKRKTDYICLDSSDPLVKQLKQQTDNGAIKSLDNIEGEELQRYVRNEVKCVKEEEEKSGWFFF